MAISRIRNLSGVCPTSAQRWILDILRYNDNSNNNVSTSFASGLLLLGANEIVWQFDDCFYIAALMRALANTLTSTRLDMDDSGFVDEEAVAAQEAALKEIERYQRMDQWQPSYQNIVSETAVEVLSPAQGVCTVHVTNRGYRSTGI
jgi:transcription initiation factor TFIID subunit 2